MKKSLSWMLVLVISVLMISVFSATGCEVFEKEAINTQSMMPGIEQIDLYENGKIRSLDELGLTNLELSH